MGEYGAWIGGTRRGLKIKRKGEENELTRGVREKEGGGGARMNWKDREMK